MAQSSVTKPLAIESRLAAFPFNPLSGSARLPSIEQAGGYRFSKIRSTSILASRLGGEGFYKSLGPTGRANPPPMIRFLSHSEVRSGLDSVSSGATAPTRHDLDSSRQNDAA
jgi:hypothetical protein